MTQTNRNPEVQVLPKMSEPTPERIYVVSYADPLEGHWWHSRMRDVEIEYVRSDVVEREKREEFFKGAIDIYTVITGLIKAGTPIEGILQLTEQSEKTLRKYVDE